MSAAYFELLREHALVIDSPHRSTFLAGDCRAVRIHGQFTLVRLIQGARYDNNHPGVYWMDADLFYETRRQAARDLQQQGIAEEKLRAYSGLVSRFQLRDQLAVSRNWSDLDQYVSLTIPRGRSIVALIGRARMQPYFSQNHPAHAGAEAAGIRIPGLGTQIVIDFDFPENHYARQLVSAPRLF